MCKKILVFGGNGFVGSRIVEYASIRGWDIYCADLNEYSNKKITKSYICDIADYTNTREVFEEIKPDAVVNVAAIANIDFAEKEKELAYSVNVTGAANIAKCCKEFSSRLIFFSSDAIFSGNEMSYSEKDEAAPINYYGSTKAKAELVVMNEHPEAVIIRISLIIGFPAVNGSNSFLEKLEADMKNNKIIYCPEEEVRTPIDIFTLSECVLELCENKISGTIQIGAKGSINRFVLVKKIAEKMGYDENLVRKKVIDLNLLTRAPRHKNGIISVEKAERLLKTKMPTIEEAIERSIKKNLW